ncbi:MAG: radical SAM protein [Fibrobacterota bacterium]
MDLNRKLKIFRCALESGATPFASLFVTRRCPLHCAYCSARRDAPGPELSTDDWKRAMKKLHGFGVRHMAFNGGEPLLREDIGELIAYAAHDLSCITWLFTSLTSLDDPLLGRLKHLDFLSASIDGLSGAGPRSDPAIFERLARCATHGITPAVLATVTADNVKGTLALARECLALNIFFDFVLVQTHGGAFSTQTGKRPDSADLKPLFRELSALRAKTGKVLASYKLLREAAEFYRRNNWKCPMTQDPFIAVDADGRLMPCQEYATDLTIFDVENLRDPRWRKAKRTVIEKCPGCSAVYNYQKTFRNPFDLLKESVALLRF